MRKHTIDTLEALTEQEFRAEFAPDFEAIPVKGFTIYLTDVGSHFGYSMICYGDGRQIKWANDYALHHDHYLKSHTRADLRELYIKQANAQLYTEEELATLDNTVPNVEGMSKADAIARFSGSGLKYNIIGNGSTVTSQIPKGGSTLPDGSTVVLYTEYMQGQQVEIPNLIGLTASEANVALNNRGLNIKEVNTNTSSTGTAKVNKQTPAAGTMVDSGTVVEV